MKTIQFLVLIVFLSLSCNHRQPYDSKINWLKQNDMALGIPQPGNWLFEHNEKGQTFEQYVSINPVSPNKVQNKIYLQPIGIESKAMRNLQQNTLEYLEIFFNLKTVINPAISEENILKNEKRKRYNGVQQFSAKYILDSILSQSIPKNAIVLMALTESDIYSKPTWNYVFGLSYLKKRIGISSFYRFYDNNIDSSNYTICLNRLIKTASHEIGHMFSMRHCINALCLMNGSNHLQELDSSPNRLCSECLKKLSWNLNMDTKKRLQELMDYFKKHKMNEDYAKTKMDLDRLNL